MNGTEAIVPWSCPLEGAASNASCPLPTGWGVWGVCVDRPLEGVGRSLEGALEGSEVPVVAAQVACRLPTVGSFSFCPDFGRWKGVLEAVGGGVTITRAASTILVRILDGGPSETTSILPAANSRRMASARASAVTLGLDFLASGSLANKLGAYDGLDLSLTLRLCLVKRRRSVRKSWFASASRASCSKVPCPGSAT